MPVTDLIQQLLIVKGVAPAVGDTASAEQGLTSVDLLTQTQQSGWSLDAENGWNPAIASLKGGGVWADSAVSSGRQLLSNEEGNVLETMQLTVTGLNVPDLAAHLSKLSKMIQDARDFWATFYQIEPVYIKWQAVGAPGPQYALIYNIEMAVVEPEDYTSTLREITLTIEREPYWRGVAPGANPKQWTFEFRNQTPASLADWALRNTAVGQLATATLENRREWNTTQTAVTSDNELVIPAADIPGDAPALVMIGAQINNASGNVSDFYVTSKPRTYKARDGSTRSVFRMLNAGDAQVGTDTTIAADTGAPNSNSQSSGQRAACTFATATIAERLRWTTTAGLESPVDLSTFRGRYAAFLRCRISAASTVELNLDIRGASTIPEGIKLPTQTLTDVGAGGTGNTTAWAFVYMGQFDVPFDGRGASVGLDGRGLYVQPNAATNTNLFIVVEAARIGGATNLYISDLILVPIDEGAIEIELPVPGDPTYFVYDNTGHMNHGKMESSTLAFNNSTESEPLLISAQGSDLYLRPGADNVIGMVARNKASGLVQSVISWSWDVTVNIVPRWSGIRDV